MQFTTGDIIVNGSSKRKVLATLEDVVFWVQLEGINNKFYAKAWDTHQELTEAGWQVEVKDWKPAEGEQYWLVDSYGDIDNDLFRDTGRQHSFRLATNNCFRTREEAERHRSEMLKSK